MPWSGLGDFDAAITRMVAAADEAAKQFVTKGGHLIERNAKLHANGRPGPNVITGSHRRSFTVAGIARTGPGAWTSSTGPTMIYSRRLELGFDQADSLGRVYQTPAYPSLGPGVKDSQHDLALLARSTYGQAVRVG